MMVQTISGTFIGRAVAALSGVSVIELLAALAREPVEDGPSPKARVPSPVAHRAGSTPSDGLSSSGGECWRAGTPTFAGLGRFSPGPADARDAMTRTPGLKQPRFGGL